MRWTLIMAALFGMAASSALAGGLYTLGPEDVLSITVYGHEDLTRDVVVLSDGQFAYPIVGSVSASGQTAEQVAAAISKGLEKELNEPSVTVTVKQPAMRRVYASGLVAKAGSYDLKPGWRVSHLVAEAGGISGKPELTKATVVRGSTNIAVDLAAVLGESNRDADIELMPGDLVQIQADTNLVHVVGQAKSPGDYQLKAKLGVLEALAMAGGATDNAALTGVQILRGARVIKVDMHAIMANGDSGANVVMEPGDTLLIPANEARIAVLGGVQQPGYYDLPDGKVVTLADAIAMARGGNKRARMTNVALVRMVGGKQIVSKVDISRFLKKGDLTQNPAVSPGDVVYVTDGSAVEPGAVLGAIMSLASPLVYTFARQ